MKIGITGGRGFLGSHLVKELENKGHTLVFFEAYGKSILDREALDKFVKGTNVILHLAGKNKGNTDELFSNNVIGTLRLLDAVKNNSSKTRIIFASSVQVYLKDSLYGLTKKQAEEIIRFYSTNYNIESIILRFTNLYGLGGRPFYNSVISTFIHQIKSGEKIKIDGNGKSRRDYLYVQDAVSAIIKSLTFKMINKFVTFDVCTGKKYSLNQIIGFLKKEWDGKIVVEHVGDGHKSWGFVVDHKRVRGILHWKPEVSFEEGIVKVLRNEN